jgi:hypothetical protein
MKVLVKRVEEACHKLYMNNLFSFAYLFDDFHKRGVNCYGTVRQHCKGIPESFNSKTQKLQG